MLVKDFLSGVEDKYDNRLLKNRLTVEGNVIAVIYSDPLILDENDLTSKDFITSDGNFYFSLAKRLRKTGYTVFDEVTILSSINDTISEEFQERGGYATLKNLVDVIDIRNADVYIDNLYRENIILSLYRDGFNLFDKVDWDGKEIVPLSLFRKMDSEGVLDWYESRLLGYSTGKSSSILEEENISFEDDFIQNCMDGISSGVPFETGGTDINGDTINIYPFLSKQISGLQHGTLSMIGGFSSAGKSTWLIGLIMGLINSGEKVILVSNEERVMRYKVKFLVYLLAKRNRYYTLTKKKFMSGNISDEDKRQIESVQKYWNDNYKGKLKIITTNDADMKIARKKIREAALKEGYSTFIVDTFKIGEGDMSASRTDLCLVRDSRDLAKLAQKLDMIGFASVQLAERDKGTLALSASVLSNAKQIKEILDNLFLIRNVYSEELDPKHKYYCRPFRLKKVDGKWIEEPYECDQTGVWRMLFVEKNRNGENSFDNGRSYGLLFDGEHSIFREVCQMRFKTGRIE